MTGLRSWRRLPQILTGKVCKVGLAMKMATTTSSQDARKAKIAAEKMPILIDGKVTRSFASNGLAPQTIAASSMDLSKPSSAALIGDDGEGEREHRVGDDEAGRGAAKPDPQEEGVDGDGEHDHRQHHRRQQKAAHGIASAKFAPDQGEGSHQAR